MLHTTIQPASNVERTPVSPSHSTLITDQAAALRQLMTAPVSIPASSPLSRKPDRAEQAAPAQHSPAHPIDQASRLRALLGKLRAVEVIS
jgi:hypothetical protein